MVLRFSTNNLASSLSDMGFFMWNIYSFFKTPPPDGPGWTIIGTSDGSTGGMADGYATTAAQFNNTGAWFAMESPDGLKQFYFRKADSNTVDARYCKTPTLTGGSATPPSSPDARQLTANNYGGYNICMCADDTYPYGFYVIMFGRTGSPLNGGTPVYLWLPIDNPHPDDDDPYAMCFSVFGMKDTYIAPTNLTVGLDKAKCWSIDGSVWQVCTVFNSDPFARADGGTKIVAKSLVVAVNNAATYPIYKGYSTFGYKWPSDEYSLPQGTLIGDNNEWIKVNEILLPWNGDLLL